MKGWFEARALNGVTGIFLLRSVANENHPGNRVAKLGDVEQPISQIDSQATIGISPEKRGDALNYAGYQVGKILRIGQNSGSRLCHPMMDPLL